MTSTTEYFGLVTPNAGVFTAKATAAIVAGDLVKGVANDDSVGATGIASFKGDEIVVDVADANTDYQTIVGIAGADAAADALLPVWTEGIFIVQAAEAIAAGESIQHTEEASHEQQFAPLDSGEGDHKIGKALTSASTADTYFVALIRV